MDSKRMADGREGKQGCMLAVVVFLTHPPTHCPPSPPSATNIMMITQQQQVYTVTLHGEQLRTDFRVINTGDKPFEFTTALHTYIEVLDVNKAKVGG